MNSVLQGSYVSPIYGPRGIVHDFIPDVDETWTARCGRWKGLATAQIKAKDAKHRPSFRATRCKLCVALEGV